MEELKRIIDDSEITKEDDALWPPPDRVGRQVCDKQNVPVNQFLSLLLYIYIASFEQSQLQLKIHWFIIEFRFCNLIREGFAIGHNVKCLHVLEKP